MRIVVKVGGSIMDNQESMDRIVSDVVSLSKRNEVILVQGGGRALNTVAEKYGIRQSWVGKPRPWRVTDKETLELMKMVICGEAYHILGLIGKHGGIGVAIGGTTGDSIIAEKQEYITFEEGGKKKRAWIGYTGITKRVEPYLIEMLLRAQIIPVLLCLGKGKKDECLNINGDELAAVAARDLKADYLILLTDVPGMMLKLGEEKTLVKKIKADKLRFMLSEGRITGGMVAKAEACVLAAKAGVRAVMADGRVKKPVYRALENNGTLVI
ncbi:MAG: acetylglutamate kinase [Candidatus Micrarchaeia archaeon]